MPANFGNGPSRPPLDPEELLAEFIKRLRKVVPGGIGVIAVVALVALVWAASGLYQVNPSEVGVVLRFGKVVSTTTPGLHWHLPWPIEKVLKPPVTVIHKEEIGFRTLDVGPPARYRTVVEEARMLTSDGNIVDLNFIVQYRIKDAKAFLFNVRDPADTLRDCAESAMREVIGHSTINMALTEGRMEIQLQTEALLQKILDDYEAGLHIMTVKLQDVEPPGPVQDAFKDVINAEQDRERMINESEGFANDILPKARGSAAQLLNEAQGYSASRVNIAKGEARRFELVHEAYKKAPEVTRKRMYLETMEVILPDIEKIIVDEKIAGALLPLLPLPGQPSTTRASQ
jgi:membrane protease subunit HflK